MRSNPLTDAQQHRAKTALLLQLASTGRYSRSELQGLCSSPWDNVLSEIFKFTDMVRLRVADDKYVTVLPGGTLQ